MKSVWQRDAILPEHPFLDGEIRTDVLVIGGGLAGLLTAWELRQRGADVVLVEKGRICCATTAVSAVLLADQIQGNQNGYEEIFSPSRSILKPQLLCNCAETAANFLIPTTKRCPHLGCALKYNREAHSWDCSCHGSRFSESGEVLDNPANG